MPLFPWRHGQFTQPRAPTDPFFEACCVRTLAGAPHDALDVLGRDTLTLPHTSLRNLLLTVQLRTSREGEGIAGGVCVRHLPLVFNKKRLVHYKLASNMPARASPSDHPATLTLSAEGFASERALGPLSIRPLSKQVSKLRFNYSS